MTQKSHLKIYIQQDVVSQIVSSIPGNTNTLARNVPPKACMSEEEELSLFPKPATVREKTNSLQVYKVESTKKVHN